MKKNILLYVTTLLFATVISQTLSSTEKPNPELPTEPKAASPATAIPLKRGTGKGHGPAMPGKAHIVSKNQEDGSPVKKAHFFGGHGPEMTRKHIGQ